MESPRGNILTYKDDDDGITYTVGASAPTNRASVTSSSSFDMSGGCMTGISPISLPIPPLPFRIRGPQNCGRDHRSCVELNPRAVPPVNGPVERLRAVGVC